MKAYRTRPGVVLTSICGEYVLVAAKAARDEVPFATQISESSAFLWKNLINGADEDTLAASVLEEYEIEDPRAARAAIRGFVGKMFELGYLVPAGKGEIES